MYLRGVGIAHLAALGSLLPQIDGLVGSDGILPFARHLARADEVLGPAARWRLPTLLWWWPTDGALHALLGVGLLLAASLVAGFPVEGPLLLALWAIILSVGSAGQIFLGFQWDTLLTEVTFAALVVARWRPGGGPAPWWGWWVQWAVLCRLMFFAGVVKLASGDPTWADGTALTYHYWTQPLPNPVSWFVDRAPTWFHRLSVLVTLVIELLAPWLVPWGPVPRLIAFAAFLVLLGGLAGTGNFGYFHLLSAVLCLPLLDDELLRRALPAKVATFLERGSDRAANVSHLGAPVGAALLSLGLVQAALQLRAPVPGPLASGFEALVPFRTVNRYGLFAVMTTRRPEIDIQGTVDGTTWVSYPFVAKPGDVSRRPPQVAPHHPRLDWEMWFAALSPCEESPWLMQLLSRLEQGSAPVLGLLADDPFDGERPLAVRAVLWDYRFAPAGGADWWVREPLGLFCPIVTSTRDRPASPPPP